MEKSFKLNEVEYKILEVKNLLKDTGNYGIYSEIDQVIRIDSDLKDDLKFNTILHELLHLVFFQQQEHELGKQEPLIQNLANDLSQILKNYYGVK